jgi:hypothetical protein
MIRAILRCVAWTGLGLVLISCGLEKNESPSGFVREAVSFTGDEDSIVVLVPPSTAAEPMIRVLRSELGEDFLIHVQSVLQDTSVEELGQFIRKTDPQAIVVVDNPVVALYGRWARSQKSPPPAILTMSSFMEELRATVPNSTGIAFEPPAVTTLSQLRSILDRPLRRAGVVYRRGFESFIDRESKRLAVEEIELVAVAVDKAPSPRALFRALRELRKQKIDVLWVSNDNALLSPELLSDVWLPQAKKSNLPVIVGVPGLVGTLPPFGTYAALPDVEGLGLQVVDFVYELKASKWDVESRPVQPPVSLQTYVDVGAARGFGMKPASEATIDVLVGLGSR